jgi:DNA-binding transcriptional LysR family regulator
MPTEAGRLAAERAAAIEAQILALDLALAERDGRTTGPLAVTVPPLLMQAGVAGDIAAFHRDYPGVAITILGSNDILNLHRREADVAIRVMRDPADSLWGRVIARQRAGWFGTPDLLRRVAADPGAPVPVISFRAWSNPLPDGVAAVFPKAYDVVETDDMIAAQAIALAGVGLLRMPCFMYRAGEGLGRCTDLPLKDYAPIWALTHPDLRRAPRVSAFMKFLAARFAARAGTYEGTDV